MKKAFSAILALAISTLATAQTFSFGTKTNPKGETVEVDGHGIILSGHHVVPVMGEIHYARVPAKDWRREIRKMKAGGITVVATYVFWIHHEPVEGLWNWSGNNNLHRFLEICKEEGMPVVLRIGPFCHGEVYQGGFPEWLTAKALADAKQYKLRSLAPGFMASVQRLYSNIYAQASDMLWKHGGPIIGVQIENECRGPWNYYMALKDMAVSIGFDTPFYTRTGWPKLNGKEEFGKLLPLYGDYADGFWDRVLTDMPGDYPKAFIMKDTRVSSVIATETFGTNQDTKMEAKDLQYPYLTCELGGGMMPAYHRRINISGNEAMPLAICKLGSGSNLPGYYMYHGGTNPAYSSLAIAAPSVTDKAGTTAPQQALSVPVVGVSTPTLAETQASPVTNYNDMPYMSYDFQSPLGEMGQLNENAFHQTRWLHQFLADWGEELSLADVDTLSEHYARRGCFEFYNDYVRILNEKGTSYVSLTNWKHGNITLSTSGIQPFAKIMKADGKGIEALYFITVKNARKFIATINGKKYTLKPDKPTSISTKEGRLELVLLSPEKARTAFVIDGKMHFAQRGGILYKGDNGAIVEETWTKSDKVKIDFTQTKQTDGIREVKMGTQKVAAMPANEDFSKAAVWSLKFSAERGPSIKTDKLMTMDLQPSPLDIPDNFFLKISYRGDVARVYADGKLVEDNFWNGKPMLVRLSDLVGKKVELRILPLGKNYPIYLQKEQKAELDAAEGDYLLSLDGIEVIERQ